MANDLSVRLLEWVETSGRALELRTARQFRSLESVAMVSQSFSYQDPDTDRTREGDVCAIYRAEAPRSYLSIAAAVECKGGKDHPWVGFYDGRVSPSLLAADWFMSVRQTFSNRELAALMDAWGRTPGLRREHVATHAVSALGKDPKEGGKNFVRDAALQAFSFARSLGPVTFTGDDEREMMWLVVPIVVTKAPMFTCELSDDGEVSLLPVDRFDLWIPTGSGRRRVYIVSEEGLLRMSQGIDACLRTWAFDMSAMDDGS